jgi:hypothetical protein
VGAAPIRGGGPDSWGRPPVAARGPALARHRVGSRRPGTCCLADLRGAAPHAPRWGTVPVPQTPPQVTWSDCAGAGADASAARGAWQHKRTGGWSRIAVRPASAPLRLHNSLATATARALRRTACAPVRPNRHWPHMRGSTGVQRPGRGGGAGPARGCGARSPANRTPAPRRRCKRRGLRVAPPRCAVCHKSKGRCPSRSPRGNRAGSPRPLRSPPWSPASGGNEVVCGSHG